VAHNFLGNAKAPNYIDLLEHMIDSYKNMGCNIMSLKIHFFYRHLNFCFKLWRRKRQTCGAFLPGYCSHGKMLTRKMQPINISWSLLDFCSRSTRLVLQQES